MQRPESSIEDALARLMPKAISEDGQRSLDTMLDELCGEEEEPSAVIPIQRRGIKGGWQILVTAGVAACLALIVTFRSESTGGAPAAPLVTTAQPQNLVLVSESDRVERMSDEGWMADPQGGMLQAVRMRVVEENSLRDEETGIVVQISEPREELLLIPVNHF